MYVAIFNLLAAFLFLAAGANDIVLAFATAVGSRSMHRRVILLFTLMAALPTFYHFRNSLINTTTTANIDPAIAKLNIYVGIAAVSTFSLFSFFLNFPLPIGFLFALFFAGSKAATVSSVRILLVSYLVLPVLAACTAWLVGRIFIRGVLFVEEAEEDRFKLTLSWCGLIYPITVALCVTSVALRYLSPTSSQVHRTIFGQVVLLASFLASYILFKVFFRAWLKRRVFLKYPPEYALYLERSERFEAGDREARGLGPIVKTQTTTTTTTITTTKQQYKNGSIVNGSSAAPTPSPTTANLGINKQSTDTISALQSPTNYPSLSVAVIAGKLALNHKRSEELFRPASILLSVATLFAVNSMESHNIIQYLKSINDAKSSASYLLWPALFFSLIGGVFLAQKPSIVFGRFIVSDMKPSQAFSIQSAILFTFLLGLFLYPQPLAPMTFLLAAISAACLGQEPASLNNRSFYHSTDLLDPLDKAVQAANHQTRNPKSVLYSIYAFWALAGLFSFSIGVLTRKENI